MSQSLVRSRALLAASTLLACAACSDSAAGPSAATAVSSGASWSSALVSGRPSNSVRYADRGAHPATGRSGTATLQALALLSRDGTTALEVSTGTIGNPGSAVGTIANLQVKRFGTDGLLLGTTNSRPGTATVSLPLVGLSRGASVQVQGNVRGIDGRRTDVVTVSAPVLRRPDLGVSNLLVPAHAVAGVPVAITALVTELAGDVGVRADCVLYVDGTRVDAATGIWIDAGDAVSCAFSHRFAAIAGSHTVTVRVENMRPADDDATNDEQSASVDVTIEHPDAFEYFASATDVTNTTADTFELHIAMKPGFVMANGTSGYDLYYGQHQVSHSQSGDFGGAMRAGVSFPLTGIELLQATSGVTLHSVSLAGIPATSTVGGVTCGGGDLEAGYSFIVCTRIESTGGVTDVRYFRRAGAVTYQSNVYSIDMYAEAGGDRYVLNGPYSSSNAGSNGAALATLGTDYRFDIRLNDRGDVYIHDHTWPLTGFNFVAADNPFACTGASDASSTTNSCSGHQVISTGLTTGYQTGTATPL